MQGPGGALLDAIEQAFRGTTGPDGVDRAELGRRGFNDTHALHRLEAIVHPAVVAEQEAFLIEHRGQPRVVFDIPLLFEKGGPDRVHAVIVVSSPAMVQRDRVLARPNLTAESFAEILDLQISAT